jgi:hypothetical protein
MGMTCTCRRDHFQAELKPFLHHNTNTRRDPRAKVMRFEAPIVAIKQCKGDSSKNEKDYTITLVLFQPLVQRILLVLTTSRHYHFMYLKKREDKEMPNVFGVLSK